MPTALPTQQPVPAPKLCRIPGIASFKVGTWNGRPFDKQFLNQLVANFRKFSAGPNAYYRPYITANHSETPLLKELRVGRLDGARMSGDTLYVDAEDVPIEVGQLVNGKMLGEPSIEIIEPKRDAAGKPVSGFVGPDGKIVDGPVIKCLTFLGPDMPAVKGLDPLPTAVFSQITGGVILRFRCSAFGGSQMQDRNTMIQALQALGLDTSTLTTEVPDQFIAALLAWAQQCNANKPAVADPTVPTQANQAAMADSNPTAANPTGAMTMPTLPTENAVTPAAAATSINDPSMTPSQVVVKFNQLFPGLLAGLQGQIANLTSQATAAAGVAARTVESGKDAVINSFFSDCGIDGTGQVTVAMQGALRPMLMACDHVQVSKFSDGKGGTVNRTALENQIANLKATLPVVKTAGHKATQPGVTQPGADGQPMTPERRKAILNGSPIGQTILDRERKAAVGAK